MNDNILRRLQDPEELFTAQDLYAAFNAIAAQMGWQRSPEFQPLEPSVETATLVVEGKRRDLKTGKPVINPETDQPYIDRVYEHLAPVIVVRARTIKDTKITIPSLMDEILGSNLNPSNRTLSNAGLIALAKAVIVSPPNLVDQVCASSDDADLLFFEDFFACFNEWLSYRSEEVSKKKSGTEESKAGSE